MCSRWSDDVRLYIEEKNQMISTVHIYDAKENYKDVEEE